MDERPENNTATMAAPRGLVGAKEPRGEIAQLLDDQNMQTEKLLGLITDLGQRLLPVLEVSNTDRAEGDEAQKQPNSDMGRGILRNTNNVRQAQSLLNEMLHRIQL